MSSQTVRTGSVARGELTAGMAACVFVAAFGYLCGRSIVVHFGLDRSESVPQAPLIVTLGALLLAFFVFSAVVGLRLRRLEEFEDAGPVDTATVDSASADYASAGSASVGSAPAGPASAGSAWARSGFGRAAPFGLASAGSTSSRGLRIAAAVFALTALFAATVAFTVVI